MGLSDLARKSLANAAWETAKKAAGHHVAPNDGIVWDVYNVLVEAYEMGARSTQKDHIVYVDKDCEVCAAERQRLSLSYK